MASHEYYNQGDQQRPPYAASTPSPAPYHHGGIPTPSPQSTPAPPYQADYSSPSSVYPPATYPTSVSPPNAQQHQSPYGHPPPNPTQSPFDTVFDDNAYPMQSNSRPGYHSSQSGDIGQQGFYQDTAYYGGAQGQPLHSQDDIPLQDRPGKDPEMNDHIYDAPGGAAAAGGASRKKKGKVRLGELGMIGSNKKRIPWVVYLFTIVQVAVFIGEIVKNGLLTKSPIAIKPQFNPMIGPSQPILITMGARYSPCMHNVRGYQDVEKSQRIAFLCPNATDTKQSSLCPLSTVCGFGAGDEYNPPDAAEKNLNHTPAPNQWFRFIVPIFLHAGLIHIGFNLLMQLTIAKDMERAIGSIRFFLVYMSAGIFGFVFSGLFTPPLIASTGASGSLFGIMALTLLDLLYSWKDRRNPVKDLLFVILDMVISFVLGLLPGLDNFAHIGGFITGIAVGVCVLHSPNSLRRRMGQEQSYAAVSEGTGETPPAFYKNPVGFFKGRKPLWWAWWLVRAGMLVMIIVVFIVMLNNFYVNQPECSWCKYLSCIDVNGWCELGTIPKATATAT